MNIKRKLKKTWRKLIFPYLNWRNKLLISKLKRKYFPDSTYIGPYEKALFVQGVIADQFLWSIKDYFKGVVLDMSTPRHWHQLIYEQPAVEKVLISDLQNEYIELRNKKSKVDVIGDFCADELPMEENSVDTVYCASILEHCVSPLKMMQNLKKIVKPNGILIFLTPYAYIDGHMEPDYWRIGTDGYKYLAEQAGLEILKIGQLADIGKCVKPVFGVSWESNGWHRGLPQSIYMIARKPAG